MGAVAIVTALEPRPAATFATVPAAAITIRPSISARSTPTSTSTPAVGPLASVIVLITSSPGPAVNPASVRSTAAASRVATASLTTAGCSLTAGRAPPVRCGRAWRWPVVGAGVERPFLSTFTVAAVVKPTGLDGRGGSVGTPRVIVTTVAPLRPPLVWMPSRVGVVSVELRVVVVTVVVPSERAHPVSTSTSSPTLSLTPSGAAAAAG